MTTAIAPSGMTENLESCGAIRTDRPSFDVWAEAWIPVRDQQGTLTLLSLRDTFRRAHELLEVSDISPLVEYGLYRFLATFLMDALRPEREQDRRDIAAAGAFDMDILDAYVRKCREDGYPLDLFDPVHPFLQAPRDSDGDGDRKLAVNLDATLPHGNNHTHFCHASLEDLSYTFAEAARFLPAVQVFCTGGGPGYHANVYGLPPFFLVARGETLFETLTNCMIPAAEHDDFDGIPPWWRNGVDVRPDPQITHISFLFGMLFPARRVRLIPEKGRVREIYMKPGLTYAVREAWKDPHVAYVDVMEGGRPTGEKRPWMFEHDVPVWVNIEQMVSPEYRPRIANNGDRVMLQMYGLQLKQAGGCVDTGKFAVRLPKAIYDNVVGRTKLVQSAKDAHDIGEALRNALPVRDSKSEKKHTRTKKKSESSFFLAKSARQAEFSRFTVDSTLRTYYAELEAPFWALVERMADVPHKDAAREEHSRWIELCSRKACDLYIEACIQEGLPSAALPDMEKHRHNLKRAVHKKLLRTNETAAGSEAVAEDENDKRRD